MTHVRPVDLPEIRAAIADQFRRVEVMRRYYGPKNMPPPSLLRDFAGAFGEGASAAEMYYVSPTMFEVVTAAAESLESFGLSQEDLPAPVGLIIFDDTETPWGLFWMSDPGSLTVMPVLEIPAGPFQAQGLQVAPEGAFVVDFGTQISEYRARHPNHAAGLVRESLAELATSWLLMQQPLARTTEVKPDRAACKRLRRMGHEPGAVRVIELRRPQGGGSSGTGSREYHHQWITRGHWRSQWYPKREVHRPVWIAPFIKGPEGAPLIGGEKVYALKR